MTSRWLMEVVVAESGEKVEWEMLPISANNRHPQIVVTARGARRQFQIDYEEQALGTTDEQIKDLLDPPIDWWTCRGCGTSIDASQPDLVVDHVRDCDLVDGAGNPVPAKS